MKEDRQIGRQAYMQAVSNFKFRIEPLLFFFFFYYYALFSLFSVSISYNCDAVPFWFLVFFVVVVVVAVAVSACDLSNFLFFRLICLVCLLACVVFRHETKYYVLVLGGDGDGGGCAM